MGENRFSIELHHDVLLIRQEGAFDAETMRGMLVAVEGAHRSAQVSRVIFDAQNADVPDQAIEQVMLPWVPASRLSHIALLLSSDVAVMRANMTAISRGWRVMAFSSERLALSWLRQDKFGRSLPQRLRNSHVLSMKERSPRA